MKALRVCGYCGQELPSHAPEGLCPNCLLDLGAAELGIAPEVQNAECGVRSGESEVGSQRTEDGGQKAVVSGQWSVVSGQ